MSNYNIDWQSGGTEGIPGKSDIILPQKTINNTSTSLSLTGKGVANYGEIQQENFIRLMEHFASAFPPPNPTIGQMWYNTGEGILYMRVDTSVVSPSHPRYFPDSPIAWVQIWPAVTTFAGISEYAAVAATINRIIGTPSVYGTAPDIADNQFGWGQTDLVPEYDAVNQLKAGFSSTTYPAQLDNNAWAILLSRLRKALRHIDAPFEAGAPTRLEQMPSSVGFIDDGRPVTAGNAMANAYNDLNSVANPTGAGTQPNYTSGFNGISQLQLQLQYAQTLAAVDYLSNHRFDRAAVSTQTQVINTQSRGSFTGTVSQTLVISFASMEAAQAYFNSGGTIRFDMSLVSPGADALSQSWAAYLQNEVSGLHLDYKGTRQGGTYHVCNGWTQSHGFYDLQTTLLPLFSGKRYRGYGTDPLATYYAIETGDSILIQGRLNPQPGGTVRLTFVITIAEENSIYDATDDGSTTVNGTLTSVQTSVKAAALNVNSPIIAFPTVVSATGIV